MSDVTTCEVQLRDEKPCGQPIERKALMPWGAVRYVCADCARAYAVIQGVVVKPLVDPPPGYVCWCGAGPAKLYTVEGLHFTLCNTHRPVDLTTLWRRLWMRIVARVRRVLHPPRELTAGEMSDLVERARKRAKSGAWHL
jgi:hypothetical protein